MKINRPEMFTRLPDAVLLDVDNTLYAYDPAHEAGYTAVRLKAASYFSMAASTFDRAFNEARAEIKCELGNTASSHSRLLYMQRTLEKMGFGSQVLLALDLEQTYWTSFLGQAVLFESVREFLDDLRIAGIPVAIVTNLTAQIQFRKLIYLGLDSCFDVIVTSEEVRLDKPHPAAFQKAVSKLRAKGDLIWMIGDDPVSDIRGARDSIRAVTLHKRNSILMNGRIGCSADASFSDFSEIRHLIRQITGKSA